MYLVSKSLNVHQLYNAILHICIMLLFSSAKSFQFTFQSLKRVLRLLQPNHAGWAEKPDVHRTSGCDRDLKVDRMLERTTLAIVSMQNAPLCHRGLPDMHHACTSQSRLARWACGIQHRRPHHHRRRH